MMKLYTSGHKPLRDSIKMIKNIQLHPNSAGTYTPDFGSRAKVETFRNGLPDVSPHKRVRAMSSQPKRKGSTDVKSNLMIARNSIAPSEPLGKIKRKSSDNTGEDYFVPGGDRTSSEWKVLTCYVT